MTARRLNIHSSEWYAFIHSFECGVADEIRDIFFKEERDEFYPRYFICLINVLTSQLLAYIFLLYSGVKLEV